MADRSVAEFFDAYSVDFNAIYGNPKGVLNLVINYLFRRSMRLRFELTMRGCEPTEGRSIVDIGCGPGHYSIDLAKRGAEAVLGIDFARRMIDLATQNAARSGVSDRCRFVRADFLTYPFGQKFDYAIVMGFMDYVANPEQVIDKVLSITRSKAFFSFPVDGGLLAWQRKQRYKNRCDLVFYTLQQLSQLFKTKVGRRFEIRRISRDFFVTVRAESLQGHK